MIEKEFSPYNEALELKELGFDEPCFGYYYNRELSFGARTSYGEVVEAPTFSQAFRWFREKYNIDAWVQPFTSIKSNGKMFLPDESYSFFIFKDGIWVDDKTDFVEPEEAELACLRKLIKTVKNK